MRSICSWTVLLCACGPGAPVRFSVSRAGCDEQCATVNVGFLLNDKSETNTLVNGTLEVAIRDGAGSTVCSAATPVEKTHEPSSFTGSHELTLRPSPACPREKEGEKRTARLVFKPEKGTPIEAVTDFIQVKPFAPPPPPRPEPPKPPAEWDAKLLARIAAALPAAGAPDQACPDGDLAQLQRRYRVELNTEYEDSIRLTAGLKPRGTGCWVPQRITGETPRLLLVDVAASCVMPTVSNSMAFKPGRYQGVVAVADLKEGKVLCWGQVGATNRDVAKGFKDENAQEIVQNDLREQIGKARLEAVRRISRKLESPPSALDPEDRAENGRIY